MPLMADPELLHRALSNLVLNAKDAMPEGGTVTIGARNREKDVEIRVSDTGEGMTPEECDRLFTPYYTTKQHGTGLGLAIVYQIVQAHEGKVWARSKEGQGTTFVLRLRSADGHALELPAKGGGSANPQALTAAAGGWGAHG